MPEAARFGRYVVVGLISMAIDVGGFYLLLALPLDYRLAVAGGYAASLVANYTLHTYFTFEAPRMTWTQVLRFCALVAVNYGLTVAIVWAAKEGLGWPALAGKIASLPVITMNGYYVCRFWVFREPAAPPRAGASQARG